MASSTLVRIRGLPWGAGENEVGLFFHPLELDPQQAVTLVNGPGGKPTGEAFVRLASPDVAAEALKYNREMLGKRYIEVFPGTEMEFQQSVQWQGVRDFSDGILRCRGLPFNCAAADVALFFADYGVTEANVSLGMHVLGQFAGSPNGEAWVKFAGEAIAKKALEERNLQIIGTRYVELYLSSEAEQQQFQNFPPPYRGTARAELGDPLAYRGYFPHMRSARQARYDHACYGNQNESWLRARGLPYSCGPGDVAAFFGGHGVLPEDVILTRGCDGRPTGEAFVRFSNARGAEMARQALNRQLLGSRYVELFTTGPEDWAALAHSQHTQGPSRAYYQQQHYGDTYMPASPSHQDCAYASDSSPTPYGNNGCSAQYGCGYGSPSSHNGDGGYSSWGGGYQGWCGGYSNGGGGMDQGHYIPQGHHMQHHQHQQQQHNHQQMQQHQHQNHQNWPPPQQQHHPPPQHPPQHQMYRQQYSPSSGAVDQGAADEHWVCVRGLYPATVPEVVALFSDFGVTDSDVAMDSSCGADKDTQVFVRFSSQVAAEAARLQFGKAAGGNYLELLHCAPEEVPRPHPLLPQGEDMPNSPCSTPNGSRDPAPGQVTPPRPQVLPTTAFSPVAAPHSPACGSCSPAHLQVPAPLSQAGPQPMQPPGSPVHQCLSGPAAPGSPMYGSGPNFGYQYAYSMGPAQCCQAGYAPPAGRF